MNYQLIAKIRGILCQECTLPFRHSILRAYRVQEEQSTQGGGIARDTVGEVKAQDLEALSPQALGRVTLNAYGQGELLIQDKAAYNGGGLLLILEVPFLEGMEGPEPRHPARYLSLGTMFPAWDTNDRASFHAKYSVCLPERVVLLLLEHFGLWIISGKVNVCDAHGKTIGPAPGLTVTAMDNDLIQDDDLGSATIDSQGHFRIAYRSRDFKRTPFSPRINIETLGGAGPDLYFIVKAGSNVLLQEDPDRGLQPDRKDVGRIACVRLCIPGARDGRVIPSVWTRVGNYHISTQGNPQAFDGPGFLHPGGTADNWAITGTIGLMGTPPYPLDPGSQEEYRFLYSSVTGDNTNAALDASTFKPVVAGDGIFVADQFVGTLQKNFPLTFVSVYLRASHLDSEGWVDLRKALEDALNATTVFSAADLSDPGQSWYFSHNSTFMRIDTHSFTAEEGRTPVPLQANVLYGGSAIPVEKIALRFEIREKGSGTPGLNNGITLNAMLVNNDAMSMDIATDNEECTIFQQEPVRLGYSLFHPYLHRVNVDSKKGRSAYIFRGAVPIPAGSDRAAGLFDLTPFLEGTCSYIARLSWSLRLTNGVDIIGGHDEVPFYYEA